MSDTTAALAVVQSEASEPNIARALRHLSEIVQASAWRDETPEYMRQHIAELARKCERALTGDSR